MSVKFFDMMYYNNSPNEQPLIFNNQITASFLDNPKQYRVAISRLAFSMYDIPLFHLTPNLYQVTLKYGGQTASSYVTLDPTLTGIAGADIYDFQSFIYMLNTAVKNAFTTLSGLTGLPTSLPPTFYWNEVTKLLSIVGDTSYLTNNLGSAVNPIQVIINESLLPILQGLPTTDLATVGTYQILFLNEQNNINTSVVPNLVTMTSQEFSFDNISDLESIVVTSNIPAQMTYRPSDLNGGGITTSEMVLGDFLMNDQNITTYHNRFMYSPIFPYQQFPLTTDNFPTNVTCYVSYTRNGSGMGERIPVMLAPYQKARIKLMFTTKELLPN